MEFRLFRLMTLAALLVSAIVACSKLPKVERSKAAAAATGDETKCDFAGTQITELEIEKEKIPFRLSFGTRCGAEKHSKFMWEAAEGSEAYSLSISSLDYPDKFAEINLAISVWFHHPLGEFDKRFYQKEIVPRLRKASRAPALENATIARDEAKARWINHMIKREDDGAGFGGGER